VGDPSALRFLGCSKPSVLESEHPPASFGSSRIAVRAEPLVFAELKIEKILGKHQLPEHRHIPRCPPRLSLSHHANGGQNLTIEWNVRSERCDKNRKDCLSGKDHPHLVYPNNALHQARCTKDV
jgi:hypothetical protein